MPKQWSHGVAQHARGAHPVWGVRNIKHDRWLMNHVGAQAATMETTFLWKKQREKEPVLCCLFCTTLKLNVIHFKHKFLRYASHPVIFCVVVVVEGKLKKMGLGYTSNLLIYILQWFKCDNIYLNNYIINMRNKRTNVRYTVTNVTLLYAIKGVLRALLLLRSRKANL